jgi:phosphomannomutase
MKYLNLYVNFLNRFINLKRPLRVVFDCSNGTTGLVLNKLITHNLQLKTYYLNIKPNGNFPAHGPDPSKPFALRDLRLAVKKHKANLGVAFDADGDRAFFVDDRGETVKPYLIAHLLFLNSRPPFVAEIATFETLKYAGLLPKKTFASKVGTYFMKKNIIKRGATLGAEYSGHYYFQESFGADDAVLAVIKIMNAVSRLPYPLSQFKAMLPKKLSTQMINIKTKEPKKLVAALKKRYRRQAVNLSEIDGVTLEFERGWITARPSNTEPLVRIFIGKTL